MDNSMRRNEKCVVGLPRCDFVFSSTRSCFIGYGFSTSKLEVDVLRGLLEERGILPEEAGGSRTPGENAFCAKICSKIITAQFCIVLMNHDVVNGSLVPNANVNMEYGLMLGFNKYVIPFQKEDEKLPFNVSALDTIKYNSQNFSSLAAEAIDQAIEATAPDPVERHEPGEAVFLYLISQGWVLATIDTEGDRAVYQLGSHLGFNLLVDMSAVNYSFLGNFTHLRSEAVLWRARMLSRAIDARLASWPVRVEAGMLTEEQAKVAEKVFRGFEVLLVVSGEAEKSAVDEALRNEPLNYTTRVISLEDVRAELEALGDVIA